jgi:putative endonuclease
MKNNQHLILGFRGEKKAQDFLCAQGYRILEHNYRTPWGEIDLIAQQGKVLCFIEIKTRTSSSYGFPADAVDSRKQKKLIKTAEHYLREMKQMISECRFDIVEVLREPGVSESFEIRLIQDAFSVE